MKNKKLKICYMGDAQSPHLKFWAQSFSKLGHEVHIISPYPSKIEGVKVHAIKTKYNKFVNYFLSYIKVNRLIKKIKPSILHGHFLGSLTLLGALTGFHPFMVTVWGSDVAVAGKKPKSLRRSIVRATLRKSDLIQVPDKSTINFLSKRYKINKQRFFVMWWGTNPDKFKPVPKRKNNQILYLRKSMFKYSTEFYIKALSLVKEKLPKFNSIMIKGKDYPKMERLIKKYKLKNNIKVLEWVDQKKVLNLMNSSLIYVDSFQRELPGCGIGVTINEAMSCELPVVLADNPGVNEYMKNNHNALIYKRGDYNEFAECMIKLLGDKKLRKKLGKNARKTIINTLNWNKNTMEIEKKYIELVKRYKKERKI